jgi:hypothetical protein
MVAGFLHIHWNSFPPVAGDSVPGQEFIGSHLIKAIFRRRCNRFRQKTAIRASSEAGWAVPSVPS